jgi:pimeloyl-ACP methyl ester carboxylesterase
MSQLDINGYSIEYHETGNGQPIVLVHGSASDCRTWQFQREAFAEEYRVIDYSRRYHWPNMPIPDGAEYSMDEHVDDLQYLLQHLDAAPAHIVGHSYGAVLGLLLALRKPALVRSLVLCEAPVLTLFVSNRPKPLELLKLLLSKPRTAVAIIRFGALGVERASRAFRNGDLQAGMQFMARAIFGPGGLADLPDSHRSQVADNLSNVRMEVLGTGFEPLDKNKLKILAAPSLLVSASNSIALFQHLTDHLETILRNVQRSEIPGASHLMHEDNPAAFNRAVLSFIDSYH